MVCAFEKSLCTMTNRIQQLTRSSNEKESELNRAKLLISRLLDVDDLKSDEIDQLLEDLSRDSTGDQLNEKHPKLATTKQLVRRHTFAADEMQLSKCKSLETCAKLDQPDGTHITGTKKVATKKSPKSNPQENAAESPKAPSSWLKFKKSFKKTSLSKFSPMHRAAPKIEPQLKTSESANESRTSDSVISSILKNSEDAIRANPYQFNNDEEDTNLLINLSSNMCNLSSTVSLASNQSAGSSLLLSHTSKVRLLDDEQLSMRKELDEKEKQLCDLRLEALTSAHQMTNLKEYLNKLMAENERLNRLIKEKSMGASLFSVNSLAESSASAGNASVCNQSLGNASHVSNTSAFNENIPSTTNAPTQSGPSSALATHSNNTLSSNVHSNGPLSAGLPNGNVLANENALSNALSSAPSNSPIGSNAFQSGRIDRQHLTSSNSITSSELRASPAADSGKMNSSMSDNAFSGASSMHCAQSDQLNNAGSHRQTQAADNADKSLCKDGLLREGKLVSVQFDRWNDHFVAQQHQCNSTKQAPDQAASRSNRFDALSSEIGLLRISKQTKWSDLNRSLKALIGDYLNTVDPARTLGIEIDSICSYELAGSKKTFYFDFNERLPSESEQLDQLVTSLKNGHLGSPTVDRRESDHNLAGNSFAENKKEPIDYLSSDTNLTIQLKCKSMLESFVLQSLIPKTVLIRLIGQLSDNNRKLIIAGPPGTGKTQLAHKLAEYLIVKLNKDGFLSSVISESSSLLSSESSNSFRSGAGSSAGSSGGLNGGLKNELNLCQNRSTAGSRIPVGSIATYCIDANNSSSLKHYLASLVQEIEQQRTDQFNDKIDYRNVPSVLIIDNLQFIPNIDEAFSSLLQLKNTPQMPFVIGTLTQGTYSQGTYGQSTTAADQQTASNQSSSQSIADCCETINRNQLAYRTAQLNPHLPFSNNFRWFTLDGHAEPVSGHLSRTLRKKVAAKCIEKVHDYLSEFSLINIESKQLERNSKDQSLTSVLNVLSDLNEKKELSIALIDWLDQALKKINHYIESHQIDAISSNMATSSIMSGSSRRIAIGPRLLTDDFPINEPSLDKARDWFNERWNYQIVPYLAEIGQTAGRLSDVEHPSVWIMKTYPFPKLLGQ